jgi:hypothetical protein
MKGTFKQVVQIARNSGLIKMGRVAIDGTKVKANASKHKAMSYDRMKQEEKRLQSEIEELLKRAERTDRQEDEQHGSEKIAGSAIAVALTSSSCTSRAAKKTMKHRFCGSPARPKRYSAGPSRCSAYSTCASRSRAAARP